ncbi:MAG: hypothetical protein HQM15_04790 [Deltaproteobacteria bacterium]|nr:hypothetical protein [Deltaproteobacteria bacterium]
MQIKILLLLGLLLIPKPGFASPIPESMPYPIDLSFLFENTQNNPAKTSLVNDGGAALIDLDREKERFSREVKTGQDFTSIRKELSDRLLELGKMREELSKEVKKKTDTNDSLSLLVKLYETMSPDKVASLLKQMPLNVSLEMIRRMKPKISSQVLAAMDEHYASEIGRRLLQSANAANPAKP